jgi:hypothetical protein
MLLPLRRGVNIGFDSIGGESAMNNRTRRSRANAYRREWHYGDRPYSVDRDFTDEVLEAANDVVPKIGGEIRSTCIGHPPSELGKNGQTIGAGTRYGHLRFAVAEPWPWLPVVIPISCLPDTTVSHTVNYRDGETTAFIEIKCSIAATARNRRLRLRWWSRLLVEMTNLTKESKVPE